MNKVIIFVDDDRIERDGARDVLSEIFLDTGLTIDAIPPFEALSEYAKLVADGEVAAVVLDQRLNTSGSVSYSGVQLASYLRAIGSRIPIVIMTNYPADDFSGEGWAVESILQKGSTLQDPTSQTAQEFKLRLVRQIAHCGDILAAREARFHELLVKSSHEPLSQEEDKALQELSGDRVAAVTVLERQREAELDADIDKLKRLLERG